MQTKQNTIIRQKQSLVHKVPSGVVILSHVYGVATKTSTLKILTIRQIWGDKGFFSFISGKIEWSRYLVFWSLGTLTSLRDWVRGLVA
jgi:hypothetical protein